MKYKMEKIYPDTVPCSTEAPACWLAAGPERAGDEGDAKMAMGRKQGLPLTKCGEQLTARHMRGQPEDPRSVRDTARGYSLVPCAFSAAVARLALCR
eukprot:COSAG05_NODE_883_length_6777_cov_36.660081_9_plen_97_part_00